MICPYCPYEVYDVLQLKNHVQFSHSNAIGTFGKPGTFKSQPKDTTGLGEYSNAQLLKELERRLKNE